MGKYWRKRSTFVKVNVEERVVCLEKETIGADNYSFKCY